MYADFEEKHDSAWVWVPNDLFDPEKAHVYYNEYIDQLAEAETLTARTLSPEVFAAHAAESLAPSEHSLGLIQLPFFILGFDVHWLITHIDHSDLERHVCHMDLTGASLLVFSGIAPTVGAEAVQLLNLGSAIEAVGHQRPPSSAFRSGNQGKPSPSRRGGPAHLPLA